MRLRGNEVCPIHRSVLCCGREPVLIEGPPAILPTIAWLPSESESDPPAET
jgi:hypothetical protein